MDDFVINVRQIGNYKQLTNLVTANDLLLVQQGGVGGPYACITQDGLLGQVFQRVNVGILPAPNNLGITSNFVTTPLGQRQGFNWYVDDDGLQRYLQNGPAGFWSMENTTGELVWATIPPGEKDDQIDPTQWTDILSLLPDGTLVVGGIQITGPPTAESDVATVAWVQANTVASFNGRIGVVTLTTADVNTAAGIAAGDAIASQSWVANHFAAGSGSFAPINSPAFTGIPTAATAAPGTSTTQLATTAFVAAAVAGTMAGVVSWNGRTGAVTMTLADVTGTGILNNTALAGIPTAPTAVANTATTQVATTAFVMNAVSGITGGGTGAGVSSFNGRSGVVTLASTDINTAGGALVASPAFTGTPTAPTASPGTSTTQLATTAFVAAAVGVAGGVTSFNTRTGAVTLTGADITGAGGALLAGPAFTGLPSAPTAAPGTNTGQLATTAFVMAAMTTAAGVTSFNGRTGAITLTTADVTGAGGATLASPALTGTPTAPTQTPGTNNTMLATTAFVTAAVGAVQVGVTSFNGRTGSITLTPTDISNAGGALLASPTFTGTPSAPTAPPGTNSAQIATTAFVTSSVATSTVGSRVALQTVRVSSPLALVNMFYNFTNTYDCYEIEIYNFNTSVDPTSGTTVQMLISIDGTSWVASGYMFAFNAWNSQIGQLGNNNGANTTPSMQLFLQGGAAAYQAYMLIKFQLPWDSVHYKAFNWKGSTQMTEGTTPTINDFSGAGMCTTFTQPLKGVQFSLLGGVGNITSGVFTIYGIVKPP